MTNQQELAQMQDFVQQHSQILCQGYYLTNLRKSKIYQLTSKVINFWRIQKNQRLIKENKIWIPRLFDMTFYRQKYPEVVTSRMHPYVHFRLFGWYQGYQPMPLFDISWYVTRYPFFNEKGANPLEHYEQIGQYTGCHPCPLFDPQWYLSENPDVQQAGIEPLYHYFHRGWREGRNPSAAFNTNEYLKQNPEVAATETNPLAHYLQNARLSQKVISFATNQPKSPVTHKEVTPKNGVQSNATRTIAKNRHSVMEMFKPILERANKTSDLAASLKILRELPFGDFALLTLNVPQEYANLKQSLPQMASDEDQRQWTGGSGTGLLQQTVDFVKSVHLTMYETGLNHDIEKRKILDFGMGWGRIIRLMYWLFEPSNIFAVDPMQSSIDVCRENNVTAHIEKVNNIVTELPFEDKFDLIYAFSVFTHIAEASSQAAQQTLRRHITDDGLFVITVRPVEYWQFVGSQGQLTSEEVEELVQSHNTTGYSFKPHNNRPDELGGGLYGDCTYSLEYIEEHWPEWKIVKVDRNFSDYLQVYVYLQPV